MNVARLKQCIRERDGMRCTKCRMSNAEHVESTGRVLDVHRLVPGSKYTAEGCVTLCRKCHRLAHRREPNQPVRLDRELARRIRILAVHRGVKPGDYIAAALAEPLSNDESAMVDSLRKSLAA